jgi:5-methylcytosine-specific restriction endonuclease McrA
MESVLLLNQDYTYLSTVSWQRAIGLMVKNKVEVLKYTDKTVANNERTYVIKVPKVIKLLYFIAKIHKVRMMYNKKVVFARDKHECGYCSSKDNLTIDHVIPKAKGGKTCFENVVTSCFSCNNIKGDRTPEQARMKLRKKLYAPTVPEYMKLKLKEMGINIEFIY